MTLLEKFKKDHPNAPMREKDGAPKVCPFHLGYTDEHDHCRGMTCVECWNREYEGEDSPVETFEASMDVGDKIIATYIKLCEYFDKGAAYTIIRDLTSGGCFKDGNNT